MLILFIFFIIVIETLRVSVFGRDSKAGSGWEMLGGGKLRFYPGGCWYGEYRNDTSRLAGEHTWLFHLVLIVRGGEAVGWRLGADISSSVLISAQVESSFLGFPECSLPGFGSDFYSQ